jgi:NADPH2:quinone reductase
MKALVCRRNAEDISTACIEDVELPPLEPDQVRFAVRAAAVNFPDVLLIQGKYQHKPPLPFIVGSECAGEVIAVGRDVIHFKPGDRVMGGGIIGCFAEENQLRESALRPIPEGVDFATAACFRTAYITAYVALVRRGALEPGETLLVHGAAGGVGLAAVDLGKLLGANVIATASSEDKREFLKAYGADHVLPSTGFRDEVKALTERHGADVIYDPVGGDVFDESVRCIAFGGRLLVVGFASGRIPTIAANMPLIKVFSVVGVRAGEYGRRSAEKGREDMLAIEKLLAEGKIRPHIHARLPLERAVEAMQMLTTRKVIGKAVIEP